MILSLHVAQSLLTVLLGLTLRSYVRFTNVFYLLVEQLHLELESREIQN
jgi:hypothetical protein